MQITKDTRVSDILLEYGDIAEVMEAFGVKRVGRYSLENVPRQGAHRGVGGARSPCAIGRVSWNPAQGDPTHAGPVRVSAQTVERSKNVGNKKQVIAVAMVVMLLSLLLFFFAIPHTLEDFALGEPVKNGIPAPILSLVVAGLFALQGLALFRVGQQDRRGYIIHAGLGIIWPLAAGLAQLPAIFAYPNYCSGFISVLYVLGMIVIGILLFLASLQALRVGRTNAARVERNLIMVTPPYVQVTLEHPGDQKKMPGIDLVAGGEALIR